VGDVRAGYLQALAERSRIGITHVIFGDIMYESNREFPERVCAAEGLIPVEPLWGEPTEALYREFVHTGADARIVTVRDRVLGPSWLGLRLTLESADDITRAGVDPCGEHGEYHTVVVDAPAVLQPDRLRRLGQVCRGGCWAVDLALDDHSSTEGSHAARV
jgi:uncharacterized protein (TIGR00290 family)